MLLPVSEEAAPHVVMLLAGAARHDTRVMREAAWLTRAGLRVTILARSPSGRLEYAEVEGAQIVRVPLEGAVARATTAQRRQRRSLGLGAGAGATDSSDWARAKALRSSAREESDRLRRRRGTVLQKAGLRWGAAVERRVGARREQAREQVAQGWEAFDDWLKDQTFGASWRRTLGGVVDDLELGFGPLLDVLAPDAIHAHDMHVLGVAVHAAERARRGGREVKVVYDAHEYVRGMAIFGNTTARRNAAWAALESEYIGLADEVITVSPQLAEFMRRDHGLPRTPTLVLNVPVPREGTAVLLPRPSVRDACGLGPSVPLAVYSGVLRGVRGVDDVVVALPDVPELHLAVVCVPTAQTPQAHATRELAQTHGVADRVHLVDAVPVADVVDYLSSASIGVIPIRGGWTSYDYCLPNKFFECLTAGLPLVVSDLPTMSGFVRAEGLGETFTPGDPATLAAALRHVLDGLDTYREAVRRSTLRVDSAWRHQEVVLREIYERVLGVRLRPEGAHLDHRPLDLHESATRSGRNEDLPDLVCLGPTNHEGWASRVAQHVRAVVPQATVEVTHVNRKRHDPPADVAVSRQDYGSATWQAARRLALHRTLTHAVWEDGRPLGGEFGDPTCVDEARMLSGVGGHGVVWLHVEPSLALQGHLPELQRLGMRVLTAEQSVAEDWGVDLVADPAEAGSAVAASLGLTEQGPATMAPGSAPVA